MITAAAPATATATAVIVVYTVVHPATKQPNKQELRRQDPALLQQIQANQGDFMRMVMEPAEGEEGDDMAELLQAMAGGAGGPGGLPPGMVQVTMTLNESILRGCVFVGVGVYYSGGLEHGVVCGHLCGDSGGSGVLCWVWVCLVE